MNVADSIIKTLAFFELFEHPLTGFEVFKWLYSQEPKGLEEVLAALRENSAIKEANGFFFLGDEKEVKQLVKKRQGRLAGNDEKMRRARKATRLISGIPFVRLVAVCNTLSFGAAEADSDIDFFIVAQKGRIWTVRFFVTVVLSFFGLRRHGRKIANRICLSFFITDDNLDLSSIALPPVCHSESECHPELVSGSPSLNESGGEILKQVQNDNKTFTSDIYLIYWITQLVPLINRENALEKFWQANSWVKEYLSNFSFGDQLPDYRQISISNWIEKWRLFHEKVMGNQLGHLREKVLRWLWLKKMAKKERSRGAADSRVVISDQMLKFHEDDRREEYRQEWRNKASP